MIVSFYDEKFNGLQNNASLVVDAASYSLIRRAVDLDELKCTCEAFTESIQPTFVVVDMSTARLPAFRSLRPIIRRRSRRPI